MKFIFFGAGYCSRFIIPYLTITCEIICTHKNKFIQQKEYKNSNLIRMYFKDFLSNKKVLMDNVSFILNSIPPSKNGDIVLKNLTNFIKTNKKTLKSYGYFSFPLWKHKEILKSLSNCNNQPGWILSRASGSASMI